MHAKAEFIQLITEGTAPEKPASKTQLDGFINTVKIPYSSFRDPDGKPFFIAESIGEKHTGIVFERATRKILFVGEEAAALGHLASLP